MPDWGHGERVTPLRLSCLMLAGLYAWILLFFFFQFLQLLPQL